MIELELKSVVNDLAHCRHNVEAAGAVLVFEGRLEDRRYDTAEKALTRLDEVLRLRVYRDPHSVRAHLEWKGPTQRSGAYKQRDELSTPSADPAGLTMLLEKLGYTPLLAIDREIAQYDLAGAMIRFETYPRMDVLVEVEGTPDQIENAIVATQLPRDGFTAERLNEFALRYRERTGAPAALSYVALAEQAVNQDMRV